MLVLMSAGNAVEAAVRRLRSETLAESSVFASLDKLTLI